MCKPADDFNERGIERLRRFTVFYITDNYTRAALWQLSVTEYDKRVAVRLVFPATFKEVKGTNIQRHKHHNRLEGL